MIFFTDMQWKSCLKSNLEQLFYSMFFKNVARLASIQGTPVSIATAKRAIFLQNILRNKAKRRPRDASRVVQSWEKR